MDTLLEQLRLALRGIVRSPGYAITAIVVLALGVGATATREALDKGLKQDQPKVDVKASAGFCRVSIVGPNWKLWSEAHKGKIADHGATVH